MTAEGEARLDRRIDNLWAIVVTLIEHTGMPESERAAFWKEVEELLGND